MILLLKIVWMNAREKNIYIEKYASNHYLHTNYIFVDYH